MTTDEKAAILKQFSIFKGIPDLLLYRLAERMRQKTFHHGDVILEQDVDDYVAYFIYTGAVSIYRTTPDGEIVNIDLIGAPDIVGEMGLIDNNPNVESAMSLEQTDALVLSQLDFQAFLHENSTLAMNMMKFFADRMRNFSLFLEDLLSKNLYERTALLLEYLAPYFPNCEITLSQEEIADLLWGTRSRVTEVLDRLEKEGKIEISYRKIKVH